MPILVLRKFDDATSLREASAAPRALLLGALTAYCLAFLALAWRCAIVQPYADMFNWVERYYRLQADHDWGRYLLAPHNEHRPAWTLLTLVLDVKAFHGSGWPFVVGGLAAIGVSAVLLAREAMRADGKALALPAAVLAVMLTLMSANVLDASIHLNDNYTHALVFAVAAIVLATPDESGARSPVRLAAALACACAAAFGNTAGLAVWPALVWGEVRRGARRSALVVLIAGAAFTATFLLAPPAIRPLQHAAMNPDAARTMALAFLNDLALPEIKVAPQLGPLFGAAVATLAAVGLITRGGVGASRAERVAVQLIAFSLVTALMAALGRSGEVAAYGAPIRYSVLLVPAHVGLLMLALPLLQRLVVRHGSAVHGLIIAAVVGLIAQEVVMGVFALRTTAILRHAIADFHAGRRTPEVLRLVSPDYDYAAALDRRLRGDGLYQRDLGQ